MTDVDEKEVLDLTTVEVEELKHEGVARKSGRYPWGSGDNPNQRHPDFLARVDILVKKGLSEKDVAAGMGMSQKELRERKSIANNAIKKADQATALKLKDKGLSNVAIGEAMGRNESSVRDLLKPANQERASVLDATTNRLREEVEEKRYLDIGAGTENHLGVSDRQLSTAVTQLRDEGYKQYYVKVQQQGTGKFTSIQVLVKPDVEYNELRENADKIRNVTSYTDDGGRNWSHTLPPINVSSKRVQVNYAEDGGGDADGVIYVRRNVKDLSMGGAKYAQVRIAVDGSHYLKGMAIYKDDMPNGVDLIFNTGKSDKGGSKLDAMKPQKGDENNPFGSVIRQLGDRDASGRVTKVTSAMNIVNEEGNWGDWSRSISSQVLSKQSLNLAKEQLKLRYDQKQSEYEAILQVTNPAVKRKLLQAFSDDMDSSSVHLKAAALPRQRSQVILPINSLKDNEVYAPNFKAGEKVVLIRYPHGGKFEIPELTVNNRNPEGRRALSGSLDAIGINARVAKKLSGADFDGDTVLVIPNNRGKIKSEATLSALKDFDPQRAYPYYEGMKIMSARTKQIQMGDVSNLITDMTIRGANNAEIARAVKHSMVVIDAEKHKLNYRQSAIDNNIKELKVKYQNGARSGATTLVSQASSSKRINDRVSRAAKDGGAIDPVTGRKMYTDKPGYEITDSKGNKSTRFKQISISRMEATDDARTLSSGTPMENAYADHANKLKALANQSRKSMLEVKNIPYSESARKVYAPQVQSLKAKLNKAQKNAPLERAAQLLAASRVKAQQDANPSMDAAELKKVKGLALDDARARYGAKKERILPDPKEWEAIQNGAISNNFMKNIVDNSDLNTLKKLATPREATVMTPAVVARAKSMRANGYDAADIADALGIPVSTLNTGLGREGDNG